MASDEAEQLLEVFEGRRPELLGFLSAQLSVLKTQASTMMGLAGLAITVTGFSGHHMVRAGRLSSGFMVAGVIGILFSILVTLRVMLQVRWVSQDLQPDLLETVRATILRRDSQQAGLRVAGVFLAIGLAGYLVSVIAAAFANGAPNMLQ
ncbi:MAG: hypothetical protein JKY65_33900 [Planctomycetes bacterium]|nr:hypothetical protein [Planctomycetota bacterium]